jgi:Rieske Fe-S protein
VGVTKRINRRQAFAGLAAAGVGTPLLAACGDDGSAGSSGSGASPSGGPLTVPVSDVPEGGGVVVDKKVVVTQPEAGEYKAFSAICTHQGCPVTRVTDTIDCPCHGSKFSVTDGSPVAGPATAPLPAMEVAVEGDSLTVT